MKLTCRAVQKQGRFVKAENGKPKNDQSDLTSTL